MADPKITITVDDDKHDRETMEQYINEARDCESYRIAWDGKLIVLFNNAQDRITLREDFLESYAVTKVTGLIAQQWDEEGWQPLGPRVSWKLMPHAIIFELQNGSRWALLHDEIKAWYEGGEFPSLHTYIGERTHASTYRE